jgi:carboxypeptidase family protein/TonB-dependent receptor-like protein
MYARLCPSVHDTSTGMVLGRVRDVDDQSPLAGAAVSTDWTEYVINGGHTGSARMRAATKSNAGGIYLLCGVPTSVALEVRTELNGIVVGPTPLAMNGRLLTRVDFAVSRKDAAGRELPLGASHADSLAFAARPPGTATLRGIVHGADGKPLHDVVVSVVGTDRSGRSDAAGAFRVDQIPAGTRTMEAKSIGMLPVTFSMDFPTHGTRDTTVSISQQAQELKAVAVEGRNPALSLMENDGYETRRSHGLGNFITAADLKKHNLPDLSAVLSTVGAIHVQHGKNGASMPQMMGQMNLQNEFCIPNFWVDGTPYLVDGARPSAKVHSPYSDLNDMVRPESIKGIEVYSTPGTVPAQYDKFSTTGCGSIVIWTR